VAVVRVAIVLGGSCPCDSCPVVVVRVAVVQVAVVLDPKNICTAVKIIVVYSLL